LTNSAQSLECDRGSIFMGVKERPADDRPIISILSGVDAISPNMALDFAQGIFPDDPQGRPLIEVFGERIKNMSPSEARAFEERHRRLAERYGSGGP